MLEKDGKFTIRIVIGKLESDGVTIETVQFV